MLKHQHRGHLYRAPAAESGFKLPPCFPRELIIGKFVRALTPRANGPQACLLAQLADATGLTPVHINRTLKGLEADGPIHRRHPRAIEIGDWRKLAKTGDCNSAYLHLHDHEAALAD